MNNKTEFSRKEFFKGSMLVAAGVAFGGALSGYAKVVSAADRPPMPTSPSAIDGPTAMKFLFNRTPIEPAKIFDNVYFVGTISVGQFVIKTSKGIIIIDTGWDEKDADLIADSMKKLGLNPAEIKYILITHGHSDHYGGAQFLKDKYSPNAKIAMNTVDDRWVSVRPSEGPYAGVRPKLDMELNDGQKIKLGDVTIQVVLTPGHTPGCLSMIVPVTDNGTPHTMAIWGGTGTPNNLDMNYLYLSSVDYFAKFAGKANVDVEMSAHGWVDNSFAKIEALLVRKPSEPHPFVLGKEKYQQYEDEFRISAKKEIEKMSKAMPKR